MTLGRTRKNGTPYYFILNIPPTGLSGEYSCMKYRCGPAHFAHCRTISETYVRHVVWYSGQCEPQEPTGREDADARSRRQGDQHLHLFKFERGTPFCLIQTKWGSFSNLKSKNFLIFHTGNLRVGEYRQLTAVGMRQPWRDSVRNVRGDAFIFTTGIFPRQACRGNNQ
jgi:hypothetical protein